jgi:hypothetical protein
MLFIIYNYDFYIIIQKLPTYKSIDYYIHRTNQIFIHDPLIGSIIH